MGVVMPNPVEYCLTDEAEVARTLSEPIGAPLLEKADVYLVSEIPRELTRKCFLTPFIKAQDTLDAAFAKLGTDASIWRCPSAALPYLS